MNFVDQEARKDTLRIKFKLTSKALQELLSNYLLISFSTFLSLLLMLLRDLFTIHRL